MIKDPNTFPASKYTQYKTSILRTKDEIKYLYNIKKKKIVRIDKTNAHHEKVYINGDVSNGSVLC